MQDVRIQKVLSEMGVCSRRAAEQIIREGRVKLNGRPVSVGDKMNTARDLLTVDDKKILIPKKREYYYLMLYKPRGYITTTSDERGRKTVMDLVADVPERVFPVGRLDKDSEGLLLFTNDGDFANLLTHPSHGVSKLYRVTVRPHATEEQIIALTNGVTLDDGSVTMPAVIRVITDEPDRTVLEMTIREGKNRQIRRMCEAVHLDVIRLRRSSLGAVKLGMLQPGEHRNLTPQEVAALRAAATKGKTTATIEKNTERNAKQAARTRGKNAAYAQKGAGKGGKKPAVHSRSAAAPRKGGIIK
jgi:23S rRNA pseudouridine2605 synthase